jgi:hypothetical protein
MLLLLSAEAFFSMVPTQETQLSRRIIRTIVLSLDIMSSPLIATIGAVWAEFSGKKMTVAIKKALSYAFESVRHEDLPICPITKILLMN